MREQLLIWNASEESEIVSLVALVSIVSVRTWAWPMIIRKIHESDAEQFLNLCNKLDTETQFMMLEPGERSTTTEEAFTAGKWPVCR
jgi:hypothetical protein